MVIFQTFIGALAAAVILSIPQQALAERLNDSFTITRLDGGSNGRMLFGTKAINNKGRVAVCGIGVALPFDSGRFRSSMSAELKELSRQFRYSLAGTQLRFSTIRFAYVEGLEAAAQTEVPCIATRTEWTPEMDGQRIEMDATAS